MKNFLTSILIICLLASCEKGDQGEPGTPGSANVKSIFPVISYADWYYADSCAAFAYPVAEITPSVIQSGAVLCYVKMSGIYVAMPYSEALPNGKEIVFNFGIAEGNILFMVGYSDHSSYYSSPTWNFKAVIISGQ